MTPKPPAKRNAHQPQPDVQAMLEATVQEHNALQSRLGAMEQELAAGHRRLAELQGRAQAFNELIQAQQPASEPAPA